MIFDVVHLAKKTISGEVKPNYVPKYSKIFRTYGPDMSRIYDQGLRADKLERVARDLKATIEQATIPVAKAKAPLWKRALGKIFG